MGNRTTIKLKGKDFPLYETKRGAFDFGTSGYKTSDIRDENIAALLSYVYHYTRACAVRERINWPYPTLSDFVDDEDGYELIEISKAFVRLIVGEKAIAKEDGSIEIEGKVITSDGEVVDAEPVGETKPEA
jgi:hypothetical protein